MIKKLDKMIEKLDKMIEKLDYKMITRLDYKMIREIRLQNDTKCNHPTSFFQLTLLTLFTRVLFFVVF